MFIDIIYEYRNHFNLLGKKGGALGAEIFEGVLTDG
jgi:hypothetical protein